MKLWNGLLIFCIALTGFFTMKVQLMAQTELDIIWIDERIQQVLQYSCSEGLARVEMNNKWGYINKDGKVVIGLQFNDAGDFREGLARVKTGYGWGYINKEGEVVIGLQFNDVGIFTKVSQRL